MTKRTRRKHKARRHPSGQTVQTGAAVERETKSVAEDARMRHYGLSKIDAGKQEAATAIGRLRLTGEISPAQYKDAKRYLDVVLAYQQAIGAPRELGSAGDLERCGGYDARAGDDPEYIERCAIDRGNMGLARRVLLEVGSLPGNALVPFAVNAWVLEDEESWSTICELRIGLNALANLWKAPEPPEA